MPPEMTQEHEMSEAESSQRQSTLFVSKDMLGRAVKPGDILSFRVVSEDEDGDVEVEIADSKANPEKDWRTEMRDEVKPEGGGY